MNVLNPPKFVTRSLIGAVGLGAFLLSMPELASAVDIQRGSDYFVSPINGSSTLLPDGTVVPLAGIPILTDTLIPGLPGFTDTKVERKADCTFVSGECTIPIEMTELYLGSVNPVNIGGFNYNLIALLDPANSTVGEMTIRETGTFDSFLDVFVEISFDPIDGGILLPTVQDRFNLTQTNASWSYTPPPNAVLVPGDEGDQDANCHTAPNTLGGVCSDTDFFPGFDGTQLVVVQHKKGSPGFPDLPNGHGTVLTTIPPVRIIPEPSTTLGLIFFGLGSVASLKRKNKTQE